MQRKQQVTQGSNEVDDSEELRVDSMPHSATTVQEGVEINVAGRIYNRTLHEDSPPPPEWAKMPDKRGVVFKNLEEQHIAPWLTNAQLRKDQGINNILLTKRVSERTFGQRSLWSAIIARHDIRNSRNEGADFGNQTSHANSHDRRLRHKWMDVGINYPVFAQLATDYAEIFNQLYNPKFDNRLMTIVYKNQKLTIVVFAADDKTPELTFENLFMRNMKR